MNIVISSNMTQSDLMAKPHDRDGIYNSQLIDFPFDS